MTQTNRLQYTPPTTVPLNLETGSTLCQGSTGETFAPGIAPIIIWIEE